MGIKGPKQPTTFGVVVIGFIVVVGFVVAGGFVVVDNLVVVGG